MQLKQDMNQILNSKQNILKKLPELNGGRVLIVGDVGLDSYLLGDVTRLSPEAPVPVLDVVQEENKLGLSANVAMNVKSMGGEPVVISVVGRDRTADQVKELFSEQGISELHLAVDSQRPTTRKMRLLSGQHHIARVDFENKTAISSQVCNEILKTVDEQISYCDVVILQDYAKGVINIALAQEIIKKAKGAGKRVLVDPYKTTPLSYYKGATLMTPNRPESLTLAKQIQVDLSDNLSEYQKIGHLLMSAIGSEQMVVTLGADGMRVFDGGEIKTLPTFAQDVFDVTGAGDTVISSIAMGLAADWSLEDSCYLANLAAGVVVAQVGCAACSQSDIQQFVAQQIEG